MKALALALLLVPTVSSAALDVTWRWDPPTQGAPVAVYEVEAMSSSPIFVTLPPDTMSLNVGTSFAPLTLTTIATITLRVPAGTSGLTIRVRGRSAQGQVGPWSETGEVFVDLGQPGQPGVPVISGVIVVALLLLLVFLGRRRG